MQEQNQYNNDFIRRVFSNDRRIYAYIFTLVPNHADAEDIFQDTMAVLWSKYNEYNPDLDFGAWAIGIAYNLVRNYRKKRSRSKLIFDSDLEHLLSAEAIHSTSSVDEHISALHQCLRKLNPQDIQITVMRYAHNVSVKEIARHLGHTTQRVYAVLARTNDHLLRCIRQVIADREVL